MPIPKRGRGRRWALLTPPSFTRHQWEMLVSQHAIQSEVMDKPESSFPGISVLTFTWWISTDVQEVIFSEIYSKTLLCYVS